MAPTKHTLVIAEAGVNHNGDIDLARRLINVAAEAGADLVKFQTFRSESNIAASAPKAGYQKATTGEAESQLDMVRKLELSREDHHSLIATCRDASIGFFSTGFDIESFEFLLDLGLTMVKIPSGEITNLPLLRRIASARLPTILSTGMANLDEIAAAVDVLEEGGVTRDQITILHCNTEYPTPIEDVNLAAMANIGAEFGTAFGYSDHTKGIEVALAATALGASVIEKHFTLDRALPGPDHAASLEPDELAAMVTGIRNIDLALSGDGIKRASPSEIANRAIARKSIIAARAIAQGETFSADNITTKRPGTGISPMRWDEIVGEKAPRGFEPDELIEL